MATLPAPPRKGETFLLTLQDLPPFKANDKSSMILQIAAYFRRLMENYHQPVPPYLLLPPAYELSSFFQCAELHIFEVLQELKRQAYDYEVRGWDAPICLRDPLGRQNTQVKINRWQTLSCAMLRHT